MTLKQGYGYLFYKLYKFYEKVSSPPFLSDWKAAVSILALEIWFLFSIIVYYKVFSKKDLVPHALTNPLTYVILAFLIMLKIILFDHKNRWKDYVNMYDKWPSGKNNRGSVIVTIIVLSIIANLIFSFYLMSKIDWSKH